MTQRWSIRKVAIAATLLSSVGMASDGLTVKVDSGTIEGARNADSSLRIFRSVPFAAPPVGDLRWQPPQPVKHWTGVRQQRALKTNRAMTARASPNRASLS